MSEDEAKAWLRDRFDVPRETWKRLEAFVAALLAENEHQNLIAASTVEQVWARHIVDSAQLLLHAPTNHDGGLWLDLGSGPGLPGLVIAILSPWRVALVESRKGRIGFLCAMLEKLSLANATVHGCRLEALAISPSSPASLRQKPESHSSSSALSPAGAQDIPCGADERVVTVPVSVISARAFAPLDKLLEKAVRFSGERTIWLLPKGKNCQNELQHIRPHWQGEFSIERSVTDPESAILVARSVRKRGKR